MVMNNIIICRPGATEAHFNERSEEKKFNKWLDTLMDEKGFKPESVIFEVEGASGTNYIPREVVIEHIKIATRQEQIKIKDTLVRIDFKNGDINHFLKHLAEGLAR